MEKKIVIRHKENKELVLRSIEAGDLDNLRNWKNESRGVFFCQEIISRGHQIIWFSEYLKDNNNYMFVVEYNGEAVGCIGFKLKDSSADIYNVILANAKYKRRGIMSSCLSLLSGYIADFYTKEITVMVLRSNTEGINFYQKNGFSCMREEDNYFLLRLAAEVCP